VLHPSFHALTTPDKVAYRMATTGEAITFRELDRRSNQGAQLFRSLGLGPGDHIALLMENSLRFLEICWAAQRSGLYYTAINGYLKADEIAYVVDDCGARAFIASPRAGGAARAALDRTAGGIALFMTGEPQPGFRSWEEALAKQVDTPVADEMVGYAMLYSSGTTGRPKGVERIFAGEPLGTVNPILRLLCVERCKMDAESVYLSPAPLYHAAPLLFTMSTAALGGTAIIMERFDPDDFLRQIEIGRVTNTQVVPTMFVRLLKLPREVRQHCDVSSLRSVIHAAAPCPVEVKERMIDWWGPIVVEYYAGTEGNGATFIDSRDWLNHRGSVGRAIVGEVKIVDEETGAELPPGKTGGVYFSGGPQFVYHNDPEKTRRAYNDKGWSTLGDVGHLDEEGYLYLTDRKAYMIISGGVNIYPQETENVLISHPAVADVAVFGVPNEEMGEEVKAIVQLTNASLSSKRLEEELIAYCRERISPIKCPRSIDFEVELPRTPTGKLLKRLLRDRYWGPAASAPSATR
jgi:long-chain acyl-CoA synthetase